MNVPDDAPNLLHQNPEVGAEDIADPFMDLYKKTRRYFCRRVLRFSSVNSVWEVAMRPRWSPADHNPIGYRSRVTKIADRAWKEVRPAPQRARNLIDVAPTLLDVHSMLAHTFDVRGRRVTPEKVALLNLRMWTTGALCWFWKHRLNGERLALFAVQKGSVTLNGIAPEPILEACLNGAYDLPNEYQ